MIVMKFGGTSVQDAAAMSRALQAVENYLAKKPIVVLSALSGATNGLLEIAEQAHRGNLEGAREIHHRLKQRHLAVAGHLLTGECLKAVRERLESDFHQIADIIQGLYLLGECTARSRDAIVSFGECMSTLIFTRALEERGYSAVLLDSRDFIQTNHDFGCAAVNQEVSFPRIRSEVRPHVEAGKVAVLQGFIGSTPEGITTTIGRGGSDYTASLVGAALRADDIQIWTDVPGILTADPRIVKNAFKIKSISFDEASELAYFGAKVLHPSTLLPAISADIPVHVYSSLRIEEAGTLISNHPIPCKTPIKSVACKKGIVLVNIHSTRMLLAYGFLRKIFEVFDRYHTVVDVVATSEVSVSLTIDSTANLDPIVKDLEACGEVEVEPKMAIICVVGDSLRSIPGVAARVFRAVDQINIRMISQGASHINVTFIVDEDKMESAVRRLHEEFFQEPDPEVFEVLD